MNVPQGYQQQANEITYRQKEIQLTINVYCSLERFASCS
jgi:hypothetical protein